MTTDLLLDALEQAIWARETSRGLIDHSDLCGQYLSLRYSERFTEVAAQPSVGSTGDSNDNALAETVIGLFKEEVIRFRGPWKSIDAIEHATRERVDWFNHRRLLRSIGDVPPAE